MLKRVYRKSKKLFRKYKKAERLYVRLSLFVATLVAFWPMIEKVLKALGKVAK